MPGFFMVFMAQRLLIIAGEPSGDHHGGDLAIELRKTMPDVELLGIGGDHMKDAGVELLYHVSQLAILGLTEIVKHLPFLRKVMNRLRDELRNDIDAVVLIDYPGFNLRVARVAKEMGVPVIYYICPQLWAWGERRVEKIRSFVDLPLVIFQFEKDFYHRFGIESDFVGHPLVDQVKITENDADFRRRNKIPSQIPIVALLPGSREQEVRQLLPTMLGVVRRVRENRAIAAVLGVAGNLPASLYDELILPEDNVIRVEGQTHELMAFAHNALVASGTATLELGFLGTPMTVLYRVSPVTYWLGRMLVKIENIALANIVLGKTVVPEFIQGDIDIEGIAATVERYLEDREHYLAVKHELSRIPAELGNTGASLRAAERIAEFLAVVELQGNGRSQLFP